MGSNPTMVMLYNISSKFEDKMSSKLLCQKSLCFLLSFSTKSGYFSHGSGSWLLCHTQMPFSLFHTVRMVQLDLNLTLASSVHACIL